eukprot:CAMPEP_0177629662 /NCGR_PEP_ID=MMETSP0447-20121125/789_1 /TAXON_ID=0 /ORGANISM="Stygamoeba regulata, Strain BSH-02190019" /LENGTH=151 /DNA_ID=CAMNT_0019131001 /DNA_START=18 /DNA_END=470 /DNA_ORIENTATION=-
MSKARKHVALNTLNNFPEPDADNVVVQVVESRGTNQLLVKFPSGDTTLALVPSKFLKKIWMKRGDYVLVRPVHGDDNRNSKVLAVIEHVLYKEQIKHIKSAGLWPAEFDDVKQAEKTKPDDSYLPDDDLFVNNNRANCYLQDSEEEEEEEE